MPGGLYLYLAVEPFAVFFDHKINVILIFMVCAGIPLGFPEPLCLCPGRGIILVEGVLLECFVHGYPYYRRKLY